MSLTYTTGLTNGTLGLSLAAINGLSYSGSASPASIPVLPALSSGAAYIWAAGSRRMISGYTGNLAQLYCATGTPGTNLIIAQNANGVADLSGVAAWSGGAAIQFDGWYNQVTGNYTATVAGQRPQYDEASFLDNTMVFDTGWNSAWNTVVTTQGVRSETITADRNNFACFAVTRHNPTPENIGRIWSADTTGAGAISLNHTPYEFSGGLSPLISNSNIFAAVNKLSVSGLVSNATNCTIHHNSQTFAGGTQASLAMTEFWLGRTDETSSFWARDSYAAGVAIAPCPNAGEVTAIKDGLYDIYNVRTSLTHRLTVIPHSLAVEYSGYTRNRTTWYYLDALLNKDVHVNVVGEAGRTLSNQMTTNVAQVTQCYDSSTTTHTLFMLNAVNDINGLASGFAGGNAGLITAAATTIYNTYITAKNVWIALGAKARVVIGTGWPTPLFWTGTAQDILDKAQVMVEWNALIIANATAEGYKVADDATIDLTGALSDTVHTNTVGAARRAAKDAIPINEIIA
jgi:hypothetical protein